MKWALPLIAVAVCASPDFYSAEQQRNNELIAEIAVEAALDLFREPPKPPTKTCDNCRGAGRVGDTRVMYECPVCGGDGVL